MRRAAATQAFEKDCVVHQLLTRSLDAGPVGAARDPEASAAELPHLRHEGEAPEGAARVERGQDLVLRQHLDEVSARVLGHRRHSKVN